MAKVTSAVSRDVDRLLELLTNTWRQVPEVAAEIDNWDIVDQVRFTEEWPLEEDRLERLERLVAKGVLTSEQMTRYGELKRVIAKNRPILQRIMAS